MIVDRGGATGWIGWAFAHPVFNTGPSLENSGKNPSKLQNSCKLLMLWMLSKFEVLPTQFLQDCAAPGRFLIILAMVDVIFPNF